MLYCSFCIIEGPETVQDFDKMEMQEIQDNIRSRRNKIFLHMEEVSIKEVAVCLSHEPLLSTHNFREHCQV